MKIPKAILSAVLIIACFSASSQERSVTPFRDDLSKKDIKMILRAVADWQIRTPLTHHTCRLDKCGSVCRYGSMGRHCRQ